MLGDAPVFGVFELVGLVSERECEVCGRRFYARTGAHRYCTPVCRARAESVVRPAKYGAAHRRVRAELARAVATGAVQCARCGDLISPAEAWDADHADGGGYLGASHARCNRAAGGVAAQRPPPPEDDPERGVYWGPPDELGRQRRWSRPWYDWRDSSSA